MIFKSIEQAKANRISGGSDYYWKCYARNGKEYWARSPHQNGCIDSRTGQWGNNDWHTGSHNQRKSA